MQLVLLLIGLEMSVLNISFSLEVRLVQTQLHSDLNSDSFTVVKYQANQMTFVLLITFTVWQYLF